MTPTIKAELPQKNSVTGTNIAIGKDGLRIFFEKPLAIDAQPILAWREEFPSLVLLLIKEMKEVKLEYHEDFLDDVIQSHIRGLQRALKARTVTDETASEPAKT